MNISNFNTIVLLEIFGSKKIKKNYFRNLSEIFFFMYFCSYKMLNELKFKIYSF